MITVDKIMSRRVLDVDMDVTVSEVREIFRHAHFHHILVKDGERLVGIVSDRDLLKAVSPFVGSGDERPRDLATLNKRVHQIMTRKPITICVDGSVLAAIRCFIEHGISCLPVVSKDGSVAGILTWRDILVAIAATAGHPNPN